MALANYTDLQASITDWMARNDITGTVTDFIALAEAKLNRELPAVVTDTTLTGTQSNRRISVSSMVEAYALWRVDSNSDEHPVTRKQDGSFPYSGVDGTPTLWTVDGENIDFDCPLSEAFTFRLRLKQRFALSGGSPTNWLLTNHPDVYLAASIVWGGMYIKDKSTVADFAALMQDAIPSIRNTIARQNLATATLDPALLVPTRYGYQDWLTG